MWVLLPGDLRLDKFIDLVKPQFLSMYNRYDNDNNNHIPDVLAKTSWFCCMQQCGHHSPQKE